MSRPGALVPVLAALGMAAACTPRTLIAPVTPKAETRPYVPPASGCNVRDFAAATDVPAGSKNLGWVTVDREEGQSDDEVLHSLRRRICELGGNALSQPAWVKGPNDEQPKLTANAWALP